MKKIFVAIMAAFALALAGCGSSGQARQPIESHKSVIGQDCPSDMEQWQCDQFSEMAENAQKEQDEGTEITVPVQTEEPIDPDEVYGGELDVSDGYVNISMASIMNYEDGVSVSLEQMQLFKDEDGLICGSSEGPNFVVQIEVAVDNSDGTDDFVVQGDPRSIPTVEYVNSDHETVIAEAEEAGLGHDAKSDKFWANMYYDGINDGKSLEDVVAPGEDWSYDFGYCLYNDADAEEEGYKAYFDTDVYDTVWVQGLTID